MVSRVSGCVCGGTVAAAQQCVLLSRNETWRPYPGENDLALLWMEDVLKRNWMFLDLLRTTFVTGSQIIPLGGGLPAMGLPTQPVRQTVLQVMLKPKRSL